MLIPNLSVCNHLIEDAYEFAHAGDHGHLEGFSSGAEAVIEGFDGVIFADGREGGHVEAAAQRQTAPIDGAFAFARAGLVVIRCNADQGAGLLTVKRSKLGQLSDDVEPRWNSLLMWGLASGIGFGIAEGIMYSSRYYNGIESWE